MITYIVEDFTEGERKYTINYTELRELYHNFIGMTDEEFSKKLPDAIHFACVVGWFKNLPNNLTIGDCGIVRTNPCHVQWERKQISLQESKTTIQIYFKTLLKKGRNQSLSTKSGRNFFAIELLM